MSDGRAYTAISKVPREIGPSLQTLQILGGLLGYLFAKPIGDAKNLYQLTGGVFNHTANINFNGVSIIVRHRYLGLDVFDQMKLEVDIQGNIPVISDQAKVDLMDFEEQFTITKPGVILSQATHSFIHGENREELRYKIDHMIEYTFCKYADAPQSSSWKMKDSKNYINYEKREQILRFGMSTKAAPLGGKYLKNKKIITSVVARHWQTRRLLGAQTSE